MYKKYFKRFLDIILSLILIIFLSPVMIFLFFLIWYIIGFPIFKQKRLGLNNKIFKIYKFKTLYDSNKNIPEEKRQTSLGNFLRKTGLDELPQLFNIFINNMSFVGPRPLLIKYLKIKEFKNHERRKCLPGITGLAQVNNFTKLKKKRRKSKWRDQFILDKKYYNNITFKLDMLIFVLTIKKIIVSKKVDYFREVKLSSKHFY